MINKIKPGQVEVFLGELYGVKLYVDPKIHYPHLASLKISGRVQCPHMLAETELHFNFLSGHIENTWHDTENIFWLEVEALLLLQLDLLAFKREIYQMRLVQKTGEVDLARKQLIQAEAKKVEAVKMLADLKVGKIKES